MLYIYTNRRNIVSREAHLQEVNRVAVFACTSSKQIVMGIIITKVNANKTCNNSIEERDSTRSAIIIVKPRVVDGDGRWLLLLVFKCLVGGKILNKLWVISI